VTVLLEADPLAWATDRPSAVAIGVFDGVHRGHQTVIGRLCDRAREQDLQTVALTFDPHPLEFVAPDRAPLLLTTIEQRIQLLGEAGIDVVGVLPFPRIRDMAPRLFAVEVLSLRLRSRVIAVGKDFRFGRDREGDVRYLRTVGAEHGFDVFAIDLVGEFDGSVVSSSRIRDLVAAGEVVEAAELLGRPHTLRGTVVHGDGRGRSIGFPTANLHVPARLAVPGNGVYAAWVEVGGVRHPAVVNIGVRPTFGLDTRAVEAHLLDFEGDLYGRELGLAFVARLRDEQRFDSIEQLVAQIGADVDHGREVLGGAR
jgi:riboflavin kinase / FMN adenylyltransferase